ncbi:hypothetical protein SES60163_11158 [Salmonella enterica subsp. salamae serovar 58:l,z13,z28:z6 str. 00-0163]|nr:hypothetical protein SES60163_11158 [Salmonella enterica subsp. salamae serovar 58:l,z13,z28:z6 str. 00-0163]
MSRADVEKVRAGLSPLARGTLIKNVLLMPHRRFIPASAGNTYVMVLVYASVPVYPR